jgi:hypothetical protein
LETSVGTRQLPLKKTAAKYRTQIQLNKSATETENIIAGGILQIFYWVCLFFLISLIGASSTLLLVKKSSLFINFNYSSIAYEYLVTFILLFIHNQ